MKEMKSTYKKYLQKPTPQMHDDFLHASGIIEYQPTNNYVFQALFQENNEALTCLICSILHLPRSFVRSIEIINPIVLGRHHESKMFILDIRVIMNDDTIINLEMQLSNEGNWPERSLGYLCRNFDNLNRGNDYIDTKPAIHIGFLDFTLFPDFPEFHATYELQNLKNHHIYTDKFMLHVIELNHIHLATEEDRSYETDKWASFFKISTWEEMRMLSKKSLTFEQAAETLYQINMDVQLRNELERYERAQARENGIKLLKQKQAQTQEQLEQLLLEKKQLEMDKEMQATTISNLELDNKSQLQLIEQLQNEIKLLQSK